MAHFLKSMQKTVGDFHARGGKVGWRYRHTGTFEEGLKLFIEVLSFQIQELGSNEQTSDLSLFNPGESLNGVAVSDIPRVLLHTKHSISDILADFRLLLETYDVDIASDKTALIALKTALEAVHDDIMIAFTRFKNLTSHFEILAIESGVENVSVLQDALNAMKAISQIGLDDFFKVLSSGEVPEAFKLDPI